MSNLGMAISIAAVSFEDIIDKNGEPYILHCLAVMEGVKQYGVDAMVPAVLHDLLEDLSGWTPSKLSRLGFSKRNVMDIELLTHSQNVPYMDYIDNMAGNLNVMRIKQADIRHNTSMLRLTGCLERDNQRRNKYAKAYMKLDSMICNELEGEYSD